MAKIAKKGFVSGIVQGVFFRANTRKQAKNIGVFGWVRNVPDGRVEVFVCGEESKVEELIAWLHKGPSSAQVDRVEMQVVDWESHKSFEII